MKNMKALIFLPVLLLGLLILKPTLLLGNVPGDFEPDCDVDFNDFSVLASAWLTQNGEPNYNPKCDISDPNDGVIDNKDLAAFAGFWLNNCLSDMVLVPAGTFQMGDSKNEGNPDELPVHTVTVDSFYMGKFEITNSEYCTFLNSAYPAYLKVVSGIVYTSIDSGNSYPYCDTSTSSSYSQIAYSGGVFSVKTKDGRDMSNDPMVMVSWYGAVAYCNWRSHQEEKEVRYDLNDPNWSCDFSKHGYRLPTEAEWEYAARGGLSGKRFPWGDTITHSQANYYSNSFYSYDISPTRCWHPTWNDRIYPYTSPVGSFPANGYGLYDMAGNVWEWCNDWYSSDYYSFSPYNNPTGPTSGSSHVPRGGSWDDYGSYCRAAIRVSGIPGSRYNYGGCRVVLDPD